MTFLLALGAIVFFGLWGFWLKLGSQDSSWTSTFLFSSFGVLIANIVFVIIAKPSLSPVSWYSIAAGIAVTIGSAFYCILMAREQVSTIAPLVALYPMVTCFLAILFLHEKVVPRQSIGIILALASIYFLNSK